MIRALIFDFDGLILETEGPEFDSWQWLFREQGTEFPLSFWPSVVGMGVGDAPSILGYLEELLGHPVDREALKEKREQYEAESLLALPIMPGVEAYLEDAKRLGLKLGLASSSDHAWVDGHLARLGLIDYFEVIRCSDDVPITKPDPALYLAALEGLGVRAEETVAFEDSPNGVAAAKGAGLYCVAVPTSITRSLNLDQADRVLDSLASLPLERLLAEMDGHHSR